MESLVNNTKSFIREHVGNYMLELGRTDERVVVVNADLMKTCRNTSFVEEYPNRSFNVGIAEQNLVSFSAGLAHEGFIPYAFSMAPFISMRACEQCRTDIAYGNCNVRLIACYSGLSGGISGATHWGIEDCAIMTSMPNMVVLEPSDSYQAKRLLDISLSHEGPVYMRITVEPTEDIYEKNIFKIGGSNEVISGEDGAFLCSGVIVSKAVHAAQKIYETTGKKVRVIDLYSIKPVDEKAIIEAAETGHVVVAQDHLKIGGLGDIVSRVIARNGLSTKLCVLGVEDEFSTMAHAPALYEKYRLDETGLTEAMLGIL